MTRPVHSRWVLVLGLLTAASFAGFALWSRFPVPYRDDWDWLHWVVSGPLTLDRLFQPHNEHLIPLPRLLFWLQYRLEGAHGWLIFWLALGCHATTVGLVLREVAARWPNQTGTSSVGDEAVGRIRPDKGLQLPASTRALRRIATGLSLALLCFSWQLQSIVFAAAILFPLVQLLATAAIAAAVRAAYAPRHSRLWWQAAAHGASIAAMLTTTNGLVVPVTLAVLAAGLRQGPWISGSHIAAATAGGAIFFVKVLAGGLPELPADVPQAGAGTMAVYFAAFFAPFLAYFSPAAAAAVGAAVPVAGGWLVTQTMRRTTAAPRIEWFGVGLLLFAFGTALLAAVGRASFGLDQVAQSRYATYTLLSWTALLLTFMSQAARLQRTPWVARLARMTRLGALPVALAFVAAHVVSGVVWHVKADHVRAAGLTIRADVPDEAWLTVLHPHAEVIRRVQALLRARKDRRHIDPRIGSDLRLPASLPTCDATLALLVIPNQTAPTIRLTGSMRTAATHGLIVNEAGVVVGLASPAPAVDTPNAPREAVVKATRAALFADARDTRWIGFARDCTACRVVAVTKDAEPLCAVVPVIAGGS